jgi:hypothetical protein
MKKSLYTAFGLFSFVLLCAGCQTTPTQAAPLPAPAAQGQPGPPGQPGAQGQPGQQGETGQTGDTGQTGNTGRTGDKGYTGDTGQKGDTGDRGKPAPCPDGQHRNTDPYNGKVTCVQNY